MFRELARKNKELPDEECLALLRNEKRGVLSVLGDGDYPYGMPMNHYYNDEDGCLYFHCGMAGHRLDALLRHNKASFCVYDEGVRSEGEWALHIKSVIVFGKIEILRDREIVERICEKLCRKFTQDEAYIQKEIRLFAQETLILKLLPEHICGKNVVEA